MDPAPPRGGASCRPRGCARALRRRGRGRASGGPGTRRAGPLRTREPAGAPPAGTRAARSGPAAGCRRPLPARRPSRCQHRPLLPPPPRGRGQPGLRQETPREGSAPAAAALAPRVGECRRDPPRALACSRSSRLRAALRPAGLPPRPHPAWSARPGPSTPARRSARQVHLAAPQLQAALTQASPPAEPLGVSPSPRAASTADPGAGRAATPFVPSREGRPAGVRLAGRHSGHPPARALQPPGRERGAGPRGSCWLIPCAEIPWVGGWECFVPPRSPACTQPFIPRSQNWGGRGQAVVQRSWWELCGRQKGGDAWSRWRGLPQPSVTPGVCGHWVCGTNLR